MKKLIFKAFRLLLLACLLTICNISTAQTFRDAEIIVTVGSDGTAQVVQNWDINIYDGTEYYLPFDNLGPMDITDLMVYEDGNAFASDGDRWDTDRTRAQKTGRCGIVRKKDGVELCWGVGEYTDHHWTISYTIHNLVMNMEEYDGMYFTFLNPGLNFPPEHIRLTIVNDTGGEPWTSDNVGIWGFRYHGTINLEDGAIVAESDRPFGYNSGLTILARFEPGLFSPATKLGKSFAKIEKQAKKGSDYKEKRSLEEWFFIIIGIGFVLAVLSMIIALIVCIILKALGYKYKKSMFGMHKITGWYRDLPLEGNIYASAYAFTKGNRFFWQTEHENNIIGAFFLKWILEGIIKVQPIEGKKHKVNLDFTKDANFKDEVEALLYSYVQAASGTNKILEADELDRWARKNYLKIIRWPGKATDAGLKWLKSKGILIGPEKATESGCEKMRHVIEFRNYLYDFTLHKERGAVEVALWKEYLIYAQLFGIAEKVARQFESLYPDQFKDFSQTTGIDPYLMQSVIIATNSVSAKAISRAQAEKSYQEAAARESKRSSGGGGFSSFGGGGGSFGGSFGGGTR